MISEQMKSGIRQVIYQEFDKTRFDKTRTEDPPTPIILYIAGAIRLGFNSKEGFKIPAVSEVVKQFESDLKNALNAYLDDKPSITEADQLELGEWVGKCLNLCVDQYDQYLDRWDPRVKERAKEIFAVQKWNFEHNRTKKTTAENVNYVPLYYARTYTPWYQRPYTSSPWIFINSGNTTNVGSATNSRHKNNDDENDKTILGAIFAILAFAAIMGSGVISAVYAAGKACKSFANVVTSKKMLRSIARMASIAAGTYVGITTGIMIGVELGSMVPGVGTLLGGAIGGVFCSGIGAALGAVVSKYVAKYVSWMKHGETNPEKWHLSDNEKINLRANKFGNSSINTMEKFLAGIKAYKGNAKSTEKVQLNHLISMLRNGRIANRFELDGEIYDLGCRVDVSIGSSETPTGFSDDDVSPPPYPPAHEENPPSFGSNQSARLYPDLYIPNPPPPVSPEYSRFQDDKQYPAEIVESLQGVLRSYK